MDVIEIDGSIHSGSGTILRLSVALASLLRKPLHVRRIRSQRAKPGLRAQHLTALRACCRLTGGDVSGDEIGSDEIYYRPGSASAEGRLSFDVGTAGSTTMLAYTLVAPALFGSGRCSFELTGGVFQDFAPSFYHTAHCLFPLIRRMGAQLELGLVRPGYVPTGQGVIQLDVVPLSGPLSPLRLIRHGSIAVVKGFSMASHLLEQRVAQRMADRCTSALGQNGIRTLIETVSDDQALQKGAALCVWAETDSGAVIGADMAGKTGRKSETIADHVVRSLLQDHRSQATVDRHLADQLILFAGLAEGTTEYLVPKATEHVEANLWLVEKILGAKAEFNGKHLTIEGVGFKT